MKSCFDSFSFHKCTFNAFHKCTIHSLACWVECNDTLTSCQTRWRYKERKVKDPPAESLLWGAVFRKRYWKKISVSPIYPRPTSSSIVSVCWARTTVSTVCSMHVSHPFLSVLQQIKLSLPLLVSRRNRPELRYTLTHMEICTNTLAHGSALHSQLQISSKWRAFYLKSRRSQRPCYSQDNTLHTLTHTC